MEMLSALPEELSVSKPSCELRNSEISLISSLLCKAGSVATLAVTKPEKLDPSVGCLPPEFKYPQLAKIMNAEILLLLLPLASLQNPGGGGTLRCPFPILIISVFGVIVRLVCSKKF